MTIKEIKEVFNTWNEKAFENKLPLPIIELTETKTFLGQFCQPKGVFWDKEPKIRISNYYDRSFEDYVNTIVHEMIHYYIYHFKIKDSSPHGREWKRIAKDINLKYGLNISRCGSANVVSEHINIKNEIKNIGVHEAVFVCELKSGRFGAAACKTENISKFAPTFKVWGLIKKFDVVLAPWNETYDLRHLRSSACVKYIDRDKYNNLLTYRKLNI